MSVQIVRDYLKQWNYEDKIQEFDESSATVELAAHAVGVIPAQIAKTLSFKVDDACVLIVAAGDAKIDNHKYKQYFHTKAKMLTPEEVIDFTGHAIGGVCPFAVDRSRVKVYLDVSMKRFDIMYPAAGSSSSAVKLTIPELETCSGYEEWIDVCKGWQEETA
mgnify:FL=1